LLIPAEAMPESGTPASRIADAAASSGNLPWIEKYRPKQLDDLMSHRDIVSTIQRFLSEGRLPHLLFYGPAGVGKTSTILAIAGQIYSKREFPTMVLDLNASDERGIGVVRNEILTFASTRTVFSAGFKLVILDEADAMTKDAQNALRRIMEKFTANVRFCLVCNYLSKIIPALQSRCTRFRFAPLPSDSVAARVRDIAVAEGANLDEAGCRALVRLSGGDMRRALNILQSTALAFPAGVDEAAVYACVGHPSPADIRRVLQHLMNEEAPAAHAAIRELCADRGVALLDVVTELHELLGRVDFPVSVRAHFYIRLADIEERLCAGATDRLQLSALIGAAMEARELLLMEKEKLDREAGQ
ncbi:hypothetical protein BOX15_Mlig026155g1, partial [Macrostomum lignano]